MIFIDKWKSKNMRKFLPEEYNASGTVYKLITLFILLNGATLLAF